MKTFLKRLFLLFAAVCFHTLVFAIPHTVEVSGSKPLSLLPHAEVYIDSRNLSLPEIVEKRLFVPYKKEAVNIGISKASVWIALTLKNSSDHPVARFIVPTSSLLEEIILYEGKDLTPLIRTGLMHTTQEHNTIYYYLPVHIPPNGTKTYYIRAQSFYSPVTFKLLLEDGKTFFESDKYVKAFNILMIGMVLALMLYAFFLSFYIRDKSYFYYGLYLFTLLYQQITYIGLTKIYFPLAFIPFDLEIVLVKLVALITTSALFAIHFLNTRQLPLIDKIYKTIIIIALAELFVLDPTKDSGITVVILTGIIFITYNLIAGIIIYKNGYKQARLFVVGFSLVFLTYVFIITDALGVTTLMIDFNNALILVTAVEAFILSLAFADRYVILQKQKRLNDRRIIEESRLRAQLIKHEVKRKTQELNRALHAQELLLREVHHRVKNNLQIILSMIRLQSDEIQDPEISQKFISLEHRINAIAKTYSMLLGSDDLEEINMETYIQSLLDDISQSYDYTYANVDVVTEVDQISLPLKQAVYIGLIINELVTNSYKYAFKGGGGIIRVALYSETVHHYTLVIEDNGSGYNIEEDRKSLGLKLIQTLIYEQLEGSMETDTHKHTKYTIRFRI
jgi:two-component sensor histidine kinase